jgi:hypothetical protein
MSRETKRVDAEEVQRRRDLFYEDVARAFDVGLERAAREAEQGNDAVEIAREALCACLHDVFVTLDHGTKLGPPVRHWPLPLSSTHQQGRTASLRREHARASERPRPSAQPAS